MPVAISTIHDGYYTVKINHEHRTFRVQTQAPGASFAPGKQVIGFLRGSDNVADYVNFAFIDDGRLVVWKRFQQGYHLTIEAARFLVEDRSIQEAAGKVYAQASGNCYICNRLLTTPESIEAGIGPTCASRL